LLQKISQFDTVGYMKVTNLHSWNLSYTQARDLQTELARKVIFVPLRNLPMLVAGLDCAVSTSQKRIFAAAAVIKLPEFELVEVVTASQKMTFPYIPGLLSFREAPACIAAVEKLKTAPDAFLIDGQGIAHPRRLGLAAHLGLFLNKPTVGCAKSRLIGTFDDPPAEKGSYTLLTDGPDVIGAVLRTKTAVKPLFISVGHLCTLEDAINITLACTTRFRLPEPARLAHQCVGSAKNSTA
jgi:deoxyribonuclease V